jgi:hypothetical protein
MRIPYISLLAAGALALGGCAYGDFGYGGGYGGGYYGGSYGYGGPYIGVGYSSGYYDPYYGGYGYGYGYDPFGWYGDYYYPGTGIYVYDSHHNRHVWNDSQRNYWTNRQAQYRSHTGRTVERSNWNGFNHRATTTTRTRTTDTTTTRPSRWSHRNPG